MKEFLSHREELLKTRRRKEPTSTFFFCAGVCQQGALKTHQTAFRLVSQTSRGSVSLSHCRLQTPCRQLKHLFGTVTFYFHHVSRPNVYSRCFIWLIVSTIQCSLRHHFFFFPKNPPSGLVGAALFMFYLSLYLNSAQFPRILSFQNNAEDCCCCADTQTGKVPPAHPAVSHIQNVSETCEAIGILL